MAVYNYPEGFTAHTIPAQVTTERYALVIDTPNPLQRLTLFVLMMNPSVADATHSDMTVNTLLTNLGERYKQVIIVNTTPIVETKSENLKAHSSQIAQRLLANQKSIAKQIQAAGHFHFLVATGNIQDGVNSKAYVDLMDYIKTHTVGDAWYTVGLTQQGYAGHPTRRPKEEVQNLKHIVQADAQWHFRLG